MRRDFDNIYREWVGNGLQHAIMGYGRSHRGEGVRKWQEFERIGRNEGAAKKEHVKKKWDKEPVKQAIVFKEGDEDIAKIEFERKQRDEELVKTESQGR